MKVNPSIAIRYKMFEMFSAMSLSENTETKISNTFKEIGSDTKKAEEHASKIIRILETSKTEEEILQKVQAL